MERGTYVIFNNQLCTVSGICDPDPEIEIDIPGRFSQYRVPKDTVRPYWLQVGDQIAFYNSTLKTACKINFMKMRNNKVFVLVEEISTGNFFEVAVDEFDSFYFKFL